MEYYLATKNKEIMNFVGKWMKPENTTLSEVTQTQKDKHKKEGRPMQECLNLS